MTVSTTRTDHPDDPQPSGSQLSDARADDPQPPSTTEPHDAEPQPRRKRRRILLLALLGVLALVIGWAAWLAYDALRAYPALDTAASSVREVQAAVGDGRTDLEPLVADAQEHAATAFDHTHGPHWSLARIVPGLGPNVRAVQSVSAAVADLTTDAIPPLVEAAGLPASFTPDGGRIDLAPIVAVGPGIVAAHATIERSLADLRAVDQDGVLLELRTAVDQAIEQLEQVAGTTDVLARTVQLLPAMLGVDGPREYLLLAQNNAEPRASGGMVGSVLLLRADDGSLEVVDQRAGSALGDLTEPVAQIDEAELALFGPTLATDMRNVTFTPDFPRAGELAKAVWEREVGGTIDGVLSVDPGALAHLLEATGPVDLPDGPVADAVGGQLTADNAVDTLLNTVYIAYETDEEQDAVFEEALEAVLDALASSTGGGAQLVDRLAASVVEGRVLLWSAHEGEQALLAGTTLAGELSTSSPTPMLGVYVNDGNVAKTSYYLRARITPSDEVCRADGVRVVTVGIELTNTAPDDARDLPERLAGSGRIVPPGYTRSNVLLYAPSGGAIEELRAPGLDGSALAVTHDGLQVVGTTIDLAPGESATLEADVAIGALTPGALSVRATPLVGLDISPSSRPLDCG